MTEKMLQRLQAMLSREGPFTDFTVDSEFLPELMTWIGDDWQRLRTVLNYTFDRGEQFGLMLVTRKVADVASSVDHRLTNNWEHRLKNPDWHK